MGHAGFSRRVNIAVVAAAGSVAMSGAAPPSSWDPPDIAFTQGTAANIPLTVPSGYTSGGIFQLESGALMQGVTLSEAGMVSYDGLGPVNSISVTFRYTEPNAIPTLTLHSGPAGTYPYMATAYPCEGAVPAGRVLVSPDDPNLRSTVLSTWPDGSAQVIVMAGETAVSLNSTKTVRLRQGIPSGNALTTADIASKFTGANAGVTVNFGTLLNWNSWGSPDRIWWANSQVICARYRLPISNKGVMEAVIDVHAFVGGRALVEITIENCAINTTGSPTLPAPQSYTGATVAVNGTTIATVSSPTNGQTFTPPTDSGSSSLVWGTQQHEGLRAWYCSTWIGGDPQIDVTHDTASMQAHPLFMKLSQTSSYNFTNYASDNYVPFSAQRHAPFNMGGTGDARWIGHLTQWDQRYVQSGNRQARRASLNSTLAVLTYAVNYRDTTTRLVPSMTQIGSKSRNGGTLPQASNGSSDPAVWEVAHQPAVGLVAFLCRPSPCFIEIAQKVATWSSTWTDPTVFMSKFYQTRGRTWAYRNLAHAAFLTPNVHADSAIPAWRTGAATKLVTDMQAFDQYRQAVATTNPLEVMVDGDVGSYLDHCPNSGTSSEGVGFQNSLWMHWFTAVTMHNVHNAKLLSGANQTSLGVLADWFGNAIVRYINEMGDEWRYIRHMTTCGQQNWNVSNGVGGWGSGLYSGPNMGSMSDWGAMNDWWMTDTYIPTNNWKVSGNSTGTERLYSGAWSNDTVANTSLNYATWFWSGLCAAVERDIPGAAAAWTKVNTMTGLATWLTGFAADPRQGFYPRNK
jgi:hypothetical protein